ncbi:MAG: L,D-transpeptidase family protein [Pseudomonadota bacterium]
MTATVRRHRCIALTLIVLALPLGAAANRLPTADRVLVDKSERMLYLLAGDDILAEFPVALGAEPVGHKAEEGDLRTPEGRYFLGGRNPDSDFFLSIHISYPNALDRARAREARRQPGGQIMIHGQPNEPKYSEAFYRSADWTNGCIAVSNAAMIDIWLMTTANTPIDIQP